MKTQKVFFGELSFIMLSQKVQAFDRICCGTMKIIYCSVYVIYVVDHQVLSLYGVLFFELSSYTCIHIIIYYI